jgi:hypothetical protein
MFGLESPFWYRLPVRIRLSALKLFIEVMMSEDDDIKDAVKKMDGKDKIVFTLVLAIVIIIGLVVIGELFITHKTGGETSLGMWELLKMTMMGLIGVVAGYIGGKKGGKED